MCNIGVVWLASDAILLPRGPRRNATVSTRLPPLLDPSDTLRPLAVGDQHRSVPGSADAKHELRSAQTNRAILVHT